MSTKGNLVRWLAILFFLGGGIGVGFIADLIASPWGAGLSGATFFILGVIFSERKLLLGWVMGLIRAARLLRQQEENPELFVQPSIVEADLYPDPLSANLSYIVINVCWDNRSFREVKIEDIRGTISISGHQPPDSFPPTIPDVHLLPFEKQKEPLRISVTVTGNGLQIVQDIRKKGSGTATIVGNLEAKINGKSAKYNSYIVAFYVN